MKKKIIPLLASTFLVFTGKINAQSESTVPPSAASFQNYVNVGVSASIGIPDVSFPLYNLESSDSALPTSVSLSYHPYNALEAEFPASEIGLGWALFKGGSITKSIRNEIDETKNIADITESEADIFYYTIPGSSGKFTIFKSSTSNDLILNNISGTKIKIEYTRDLTSTKLIINSFKITDDKGYQYFFNDLNLALTGYTTNYKTGFELSQIKDAGNREIINYTYDKKIKYVGTSTVKKYQYSKLKDVVTSKGKLSFTFNYDSSLDSQLIPTSDPYSVNSVSLIDKQGQLISRYEFTYGSVETMNLDRNGNNIYKRSLASIKKLDKNLTIQEQTGFEYNDRYNSDYLTTYGSCFSTGLPHGYKINLLRKITFPTKGYIVYNFEDNELYGDMSSYDYTNYNYIANPVYQHYEETTFPYDTSSNTPQTYTFQVYGASGTQYPISLINESNNELLPDDPFNPPPVFSFTVKNSGGTVMSPQTTSSGCTYGNYLLYPGTYTIVTNNVIDDGVFRLNQIKSQSPPYNNRGRTTEGARIKSISSYDADGTLVKTKNYEYNSFSNPLDGTGYLYTKELNEESDLVLSGMVLYRNVKETEVSGTENNGSIQYTYKTPDDYKTAGLWWTYLYYNLTSKGLLQKREVRDHNNQLQEKAEYTYTINDIPGASAHYTEFGSYIPGYIQNVVETQTSKRGANDFVTTTESTVSPNNFQLVSTKVTTHNGDIQETTIKYAQDLSDTRLINANIISVPLETTVKENGNIFSTSKTLFANTGHFYPTSVVATDLAQNPETKMTFDLYDENGNLVQMTNKAGISTTTIWGYHKSLPIAQIVGAKYSDISSLSVITNAISASDADDYDGSTEANLLTALNALRLNSTLQQYPITVYTYDPLVGITNSISANGIKATYTYDASGRLSTVKDSNGKVLKENQYNYKH